MRKGVCKGFRLKAELPADRGRFQIGPPNTGFMQKSNTKPANVEIIDVMLLAS